MGKRGSCTRALEGNPKLVSVVLPVYNGARFLRQAIESCLQQTYHDIELIIVDDGSKDNSIDIVESYADERIKLVCHGVNKKLPAALNTGFEYSSGTYLTWTSHDNYFVSTAIAEMVGFLEDNPQADLVFANEYAIDEEGQLLNQFNPGPWEALVERNCMSGCFLYRRKVYDVLGPYSEQAFLAEDYEYWLRASTCFNFAHLDRTLYHYRLHSGSLTSRFNEGEVIEVSLAVKRQFLGQHPWRNRRLLHRAHLSAAFHLYEKNRLPAARRAAMWAIVFNPRCLSNYDLLVTLAALCLGRRGFGVLQQAKHAIQRVANHPL